jgi:hypothetical protein
VPQLFLDAVVRAGARRELLERDVEEADRLLVVAEAAVRGREICGDQAVVLRRVEVACDRVRLDEPRDRAVVVTRGAQRKRQVETRPCATESTRPERS